MKKSTIYILTLVLVLSMLCACGDKSGKPEVSDDPGTSMTDDITGAVDDAVDDTEEAVDDMLDGDKNDGAVTDKDGIIGEDNKGGITAGDNNMSGGTATGTGNGATATDVPPADELIGKDRK